MDNRSGQQCDTALIDAASVSDLAALLYPLGLFNQRASSLVRFSQQYLQLSWPLVSSDASGLPVTIPAPIPIFTPSPISRFSPSPKTEPLPEDLDLDVRIFFGAGIYASDSFRIYSDLLPGRGGPEKEGKWVKKWERARRRRQARGIEKRDEGLKEIPEAGSEDEEDVGSEQEVQGDVIPGVEDLAGWISDEEGDDSADEWRKVRPTGKSRSTCGQSSESGIESRADGVACRQGAQALSGEAAWFGST